VGGESRRYMSSKAVTDMDEERFCWERGYANHEDKRKSRERTEVFVGHQVRVQKEGGEGGGGGSRIRKRSAD